MNPNVYISKAIEGITVCYYTYVRKFFELTCMEYVKTFIPPFVTIKYCMLRVYLFQNDDIAQFKQWWHFYLGCFDWWRGC